MKTIIRWLGVLGAIALSPAALANVPGGGTGTGPDVTLTDLGSTVVVDNGIVRATIVKSSAHISSLQYGGVEMVSTSGHIYFSMDGGSSYEQPSGCVYSTTALTPDMVDVSLLRLYTTQHHPFDIEIHYVLRRGNTGLYAYAILNHPTTYPAAGVSEWRMVWKLPAQDADTYRFERLYVDALRNWEMPSIYDERNAQRTGIAEINLLTTGVRAGLYDSKYAYNANYWNLGCYGHASDVNDLGVWLIFGSHEFFNDGPTKQDLTSADGIIHVHFGMNHYNGSSTSVAPGESWSKIYGPYLLYLNGNVGGGDAAWADAQVQADAESQAWPYAWLSGNPAYPPAAGRGTITGTFVVNDALVPALSGANAWVGVAQPDPGRNWQFESKRYQYWVHADANGGFRIPNVRPGAYTLFAFVNGAVEEYSQAGVVVQAGATTSLGNVTWNVPHRGSTIAWEIGVPDRSAAEFRHGTDYFMPYTYDQFVSQLSDPLEYTVGVSDWSTDWNYVQTHTIGSAVSSTWNWRIYFNLDTVPASGNATLTLAFASSDHARITVNVNDTTTVGNFYPENGGGNALIREGIHAKYSVSYVDIPVALLNVGWNTITLAQASTGHAMYDYLRLEMP